MQQKHNSNDYVKLYISLSMYTIKFHEFNSKLVMAIDVFDHFIALECEVHILLNVFFSVTMEFE